MPLSQANDRELLHLRDIALRGYLRDDGLVDIEAHLTDTKTYGFGNRDRGRIAAGEALHGMWLRLTVDQALTVQAAEASMDFTPHMICPGAAPNFAGLAGLTIGKGFLKGSMERVGGTKGCTHLRELLQQMATVAIQTMFSVKSHRAGPRQAEPREAGPSPKENRHERREVPKFLINTCHAYDENGPLVAGRAPKQEQVDG
jgi:hypothetical protein